MLYSATSVIMPELDLVGQAEILSKYGYDGIELRVRNCSEQARIEAKPAFWGYHVNDITPANFKKKAPEIRKVLKDHGIKMAGIAAAVLCNDIEQFKLLLEGAVKTKAPWIRVGASRPYYDGDNYQEILGETIAGYARCIDLARGTGVKLLIEMHGWQIHPSASLARKIVENFSPDEAGVNYDPQNMVKDGYETPEIAFQILGPYLAHCHFGAWKPYQDGVDEDGTAIWKWANAKLSEGLFNFPKAMKLLKKYNYRGYISIEDFSQAPLEEKLKDSIEYLRRLEAKD